MERKRRIINWILKGLVVIFLLLVRYELAILQRYLGVSIWYSVGFDMAFLAILTVWIVQHDKRAVRVA